MEDFGIDTTLSEFFSAVGVEKRKQKKELDNLISNSFDDFFIRPLQEEISHKKVKKIKLKKEVIQETSDNTKIPETLMEKSLGLLSEPSSVKVQKDPLTPLDQKFATLDDLQEHYKLFLNRIQQQLSTLGGGGETNLTFMDVPVTSVTTSSYTITPRDYYIGVNYAGAVTITLPKADRQGKIFVVKDELGEASKGTNRYITVLPTGSDLIDGRDRAILAYNYGSLTFVWKGNSWRVI